MTKDIDTAALRCVVSAVRTGSIGRSAEALTTRYDKLAANYLAFVQLASIRSWLRVNESTP
jgi:transposase